MIVQKGLIMHEKRQKIEFLDLKNLLLSGIFLSRMQCNNTFSSSGNLKKHIKTHSGEKPFSCTQCNYTCSRDDNLKIHARTHSREKPFKCTQCNYTCIRPSDLKEHQP